MWDFRVDDYDTVPTLPCNMASTSQNASIISRNLSTSMRDNYEQHGVAEVRLLSFESDKNLIHRRCSTTRKSVPRIGIPISPASVYVYSPGSIGVVFHRILILRTSSNAVRF